MTPPRYLARFAGREVTADDCTALVAALPGIDPAYATLPNTPEGDELALHLRYQHAVITGTIIQSGLIAGARDEALINDEDARILAHDLSEPVELSEPFESPVPLVVISLHYAPFTDLTPPVGDIIMLDPYDERSYLESLAEIGWIEFFKAEDQC